MDATDDEVARGSEVAGEGKRGGREMWDFGGFGRGSGGHWWVKSRLGVDGAGSHWRPNGGSRLS